MADIRVAIEMYAVIRPVCVTFTLVAVAVVIAADFSRTAVLGAPTGTGTRTDTNDGLLKIIEALSLRVLTLEGRQVVWKCTAVHHEAEYILGRTLR